MEYALICARHSADQPHSDYHPLTLETIRLLLRITQLTSDPVERDSIQRRLTQDIRGNTCPALTTGKVAKHRAVLSNLLLALTPTEEVYILAYQAYTIMEL